MNYRSLKQCVDDLMRHNHLLQVDDEIDPHLEAAEIHRRVFARGGPALMFANVQGCRFPMVSNLFGTMVRTRFIFRHTMDRVRRLIELKTNPAGLARQPWHAVPAGLSALKMLPRRCRTGPVLENRTRIPELPQLTSWPLDGGAFVTLPQVLTQDVTQPALLKSNLGMYRVQLSGNDYENGREVGLHYQIHRGIGVHHAAAMQAGKPFRVNIFVGGAPAMTVAAVMPLPEGMSELSFAGALAGHRIPMIRRRQELPIYADADFCITGTVDPHRLRPEGPFGDHLGYYSLRHDFPVLRVDGVFHRPHAIWPFTVVGRPPQEDTMFGELIHELTGPVIPTVIPGVHGVHAVDAAGVHPLLLAIGSERYMPFVQAGRPGELLTQAHAILGQGQLSLAKYLLIINYQDNPGLDIHDVGGFLAHLLSRVDWCRDLHFQTCTTIDTLDYTGTALNEGSKVIVAAVGPPRRELPTEVPSLEWPDGFGHPRVCQPGVLALKAPSATAAHALSGSLRSFCAAFDAQAPLCAFPLIVLVDDSEFTAAALNNFLWVTFTRSNPSHDIDGIEEFTENKHWGCRGSLVIDARRKPHHAPPVEPDPETVRRVDALAARGGPLGRWL